MQARKTRMNARTAAYWTTTTLVALALLSGGAASLLGAEGPVRGMAELGYPAYFVTLLGLWKVLGSLAILAPRLPLLKEWAYAGIAFNLSGAAVSHFAMGHPAAKVIVPLVILGLAAASWALRPASRRLVLAATEPIEPEPARAIVPQTARAAG
jgi:DoxX-like protein